MTTTFLAYFPSPPRGVWHLGPIPIRAYAVFIIIGIVVALLVGDRRWEARGGQRGVIYDIALWAVPFGLIGGRLYHLSTDWRTYFGNGGAGLAAALRIWDGGLGIWGAVALGGVGAWIACRRRDIPLPAFGDAVAPGIVLAQAVGRLGNYFNQELFGRETTMPWGLEVFYRRDPSGFVDVHSLDGVSTGQLALVVQPTFLYEMLWNITVFGLLIYLDRRFVIGHGRLFATYVAGYCVGRFSIELLRDDAATHVAGIRINSFTSTFVFIGAIVYIVLAPKGREDPATLRGATAGEEPPVTEPATELAAVGAASGTAAASSVGKPAQSHTAAVTDEPAEVEQSEPEVQAIAAEAEAADIVESDELEQMIAEAEAMAQPAAVPGESVHADAVIDDTVGDQLAEPEPVIGEAEVEQPEAETVEEAVAEPMPEVLDVEAVNEPEPEALAAEVEAPAAEAVAEPVPEVLDVEAVAGQAETVADPEAVSGESADSGAVFDDTAGDQLEEPEPVIGEAEVEQPEAETVEEAEAESEPEVLETEALPGESADSGAVIDDTAGDQLEEPEAVIGEAEVEQPEAETVEEAEAESEPEVESIDEHAANGIAEEVTTEGTDDVDKAPQAAPAPESTDTTAVTPRRGLRRLWRRRR